MAITKVERIANGRVRCTIDDRFTIDVDDDGGFLEWLGDSEQ